MRIPDNLIGQISGEEIDQQYAISQKRHRNTMSFLDHWFAIITHPSVLTVFTFILVIVFVITRYIDNPLAAKISADLWKFLSYLATAIVSYIITILFEKRKARIDN